MAVTSDTDLDTLIPLDNDQYDEKHQKVLEETKKISKAFLIASSVGYFSESMMLGTWILFAKSLKDCTDAAVTILVFSQSILQVIGISLSSILSDKYGFDVIALFTAIFMLISAILHVVSFSVVTLGIAMFIKGLIMDDIEVLSLGFFAKLLPQKYAAEYTGYWHAFTTITVLSGFVFAGILSSYMQMSYRLVFIVALILIILRTIFVYITIFNTQSILRQHQLQFVSYYAQKKIIDIQQTGFPLCLEQIKEAKTNGNNALTFRFNKRWIVELTLNLVQFAFSSCFLVVTFQFINMYMLDRFGLSVVLTTTQIVVGSVSYAVVSFTLPNYIQHLTLLEKYVLCIPLYVIAFVIFIIALPFTDDEYIYLFWLWWFIGGAVFGATFVISEICVLELQPKRHSGKINGLKTAMRFGMAAIISGLIAYYWNVGDEHVWFAYFQGINYIIAFCFNIILIIINCVSVPQ